MPRARTTSWQAPRRAAPPVRKPGPVLLAVLLAALLPGCDLDLGDSPFLCNKGGNPECPNGYECRNEVCVPEGTCPESVPACRKNTVCGNGKCETGETSANCPKDCKGTTDGPRRDTGGPDQGLPPDQGVPPDTRPPDTAQPKGTFGDRCTLSKPCETAYTCLSFVSGADGFCSKQCFNSLQPCTGGPGTTKPYCILSDGNGGEFCAFVCKLGTTTAPCPSTLKCGTSPNPPGSTQYLCEP
jgi:hypothetical protein